MIPECSSSSEDDSSPTEAINRSTRSDLTKQTLNKKLIPKWGLSNYASVDLELQEDTISQELEILNAPAYSISNLIDQRSLRLLSIYFYESRRVGIVNGKAISQNLQMFHEYPAYRHLYCALITLAHADYYPTSDGKAYVYGEILEAIRIMRDPLRETNDEVELRCRALLALLETLRSHDSRDFMPIVRSVVGLFEEWRISMKSVPEHVARQRQEIMGRLSLIVSAGKSHWKSILELQKQEIVHGCARFQKPDLQSAFFEYLSQMELTALINEAAYGYSIAEPLNREKMKQRLQSWHDVFLKATARPELFDLEDLVQIRLYVAHYLRCKIVLDACVYETEDLYAQHEADFATILDCMDQILASGEWNSERMWIGLVGPLFFVAVHCRKREIRLRALDFLRRCNIREKTWNSRVAYIIASAVVAVETSNESGGQEYDKPVARLLNADFHHSSQQLSIKYLDMLDARREKKFIITVIGKQDIAACVRLPVWPLQAEVRTHGAAFALCTLGGPLDAEFEVDREDYLRWLKLTLMPKKYKSLENGT